MKKTQTSLIELLESPKEVDRLNRELIALIDESGVPENSEANALLAREMANRISRRIHELAGIQKVIGVELEFIAGSPKIRFFEMAGGCASC